MTRVDHTAHNVFQRENVARWVTFTGFWGFVFYLISFMSILTGHRRQPARVHTNTALVGMGVHIATFVSAGSIFSALSSLVRQQTTIAQTRERIKNGTFETSIALQALAGATGSVIPLVMAVGSMRAAERMTGRPVFEDAQDINWIRATGTNILASGFAALAVSRIAAWIVRDARAVYEQQ